MTAVLLGSIGTLVDTSELQRQAFNDAFVAHGLDWTWGREDYVAMLSRSGGADRVARYAAERGEQVDAGAVHATKSALFRSGLASAGLPPRPGVVETVRAARAAGHQVALVTTTSAANVDAVLDALQPALGRADFDLVVDLGGVVAPKPDRAAYDLALAALGETAQTAVAVEDNVDGVAAATAAGLRCVAFPNENTRSDDFAEAHARVDVLDLAQLLTVRAVQAR